MSFIEGGKYQSSAAMGSSAQELSSGLLIDLVGFTILATEKFIPWDEYNNPDRAKWLPALTKNQQNSLNIYRAKFALSTELFFIVMSDGMEHVTEHNPEPEPSQYTIKGNLATKILESYKQHRYNRDDSEKENFSFLNNFVDNYLTGKNLQLSMLSQTIKIKIEQVYQWSIPYSETKPLYKTRRGARGKNRSNKKK